MSEEECVAPADAIECGDQEEADGGVSDGGEHKVQDRISGELKKESEHFQL
jgi:hypothetical protein